MGATPRSDGGFAPQGFSLVKFFFLATFAAAVPAQSVATASGLVALNSLLAMVGGIIAAAVVSRADSGFVHNGALAWLVAVCVGSDIMHPIGALLVGGAACGIFARRRSLDPLHRLQPGSRILTAAGPARHDAISVPGGIWLARD